MVCLMIFMQTELKRSAQYLNMTVEEATEKYKAICSENNIEANDELGVGLMAKLCYVSLRLELNKLWRQRHWRLMVLRKLL